MSSLVEIRNLKKSYPSPEGEIVTILDIPHFSLDPGEQVALVGESGAGKTTLLNLLAGIVTASGGSVMLDGQDLGGLGEAARDRLRGRCLGFIFQTFNLLQGYSALENVALAMMLGSKVDLDRASHLLERVGLADRMHYKPRQLSVGQQQRVAVARAMANQPRLVLADEPTGSLDAERAEEVLNLVSETCQEAGAGLILVTHDTRALSRFSRVESLRELNQCAPGRPL